MRRGEVWWARLNAPFGSEPGFDRPVVIVSGNEFNETRIQTVIVAILTRSLRLAEIPGNVSVPARRAGLRYRSVINVTQLLTLDRRRMLERLGRLDGELLRSLDAGLRQSLDLDVQR